MERLIEEALESWKRAELVGYDVTSFAERKGRNECFENKLIKFKCEGGENKDFLIWGLFLLAYGEFAEEDLHESESKDEDMVNDMSEVSDLDTSMSEKCNEGAEKIFMNGRFGTVSEQLKNISKSDLKLQLEDLLKCRFVIDLSEAVKLVRIVNNWTSNDSISGEEVIRPRTISCHENGLTSDEKIQIDGFTGLSNSEQRASRRESSTLIFNIFHLAILAHNQSRGHRSNVFKFIIRYIMEQCRLDLLKNWTGMNDGKEEIDSEYILRNFKLAFTEKIGGEAKSYMKGMNAIHLACLCNCLAFKEINDELNDELLYTDILGKKYKNDDGTIDYDLLCIYKDLQQCIRDVLSSSMVAETEITKETPKDIAAHFANVQNCCQDISYVDSINDFSRFRAMYGDCQSYKDCSLGLPVDKNGESILHYAARRNDVSQLQEFLSEAWTFTGYSRHSIKFNDIHDNYAINSIKFDEIGIKWHKGSCILRPNNNGQTPFHLANSLQVIEFLLSYYDTKIPRNKDKSGNHVFQNLLKKDERLARRVLDGCMRTNQAESCEEAGKRRKRIEDEANERFGNSKGVYHINFSDEMKERGYITKLSLEDENLIVGLNLEGFLDEKNKFNMDYHRYMVEDGPQLIYHPVSVVMTQLKWTCKSIVVKYLHPSIQLILTAFLTWMTLCEFDKVEEKSPKIFAGRLDMLTTCQLDKQALIDPPSCSWSLIHKNTSSNESIKITESEDSHCFMPALFTSICLLFLTGFELWQITRAPMRYFRKYGNWLDLFLLISTTASLTSLLHLDFSKAIMLDRIEESIGLRFFSGVSIFIAWFKIVYLLQNLPKAGRYIRIFKIVSKELIFFLVLYFPILLAFSFCFYVLMPSKNKTFKNIWTSSLKVFAMLVGELDYDGTFINNEHFEDENGFQVFFLQIMSICFLCLVSIVISNLLTGLAIKEIDKLISEAWETDVKEKTDELIEDDVVTYKLTCFKDILFKKLAGRKVIYIKPNEIITEKKGKISKLWNSIKYQDNTHTIYCNVTLPKRASENPWDFNIDNLEKTDFKFPPKLINLILGDLKVKEKVELKKSMKTSEEIWSQGRELINLLTTMQASVSNALNLIERSKMGIAEASLMTE